ncbi:MAG: S24 family peptidase [Lentisphaeria bacterium]
MTYPITARLITLLQNELKRCGNNTASLARKLDINPSYIFKYLHGTVKSVQADTWAKLCLFFPELDERPMIFHGNTAPVHASVRHFPVISSDVVAEASQFFYLPIAEYAIENPKNLLSFSRGQPGDFAIQVVGDTMLPWFPQGTILLVRSNVRLSNWDPVVAILATGEVVFRIFFAGTGKITLASLDGDEEHTYQFDKNDYEYVKTVYKVIESMRDDAASVQAMRSRGLLSALEKYEQA